MRGSAQHGAHNRADTCRTAVEQQQQGRAKTDQDATHKGLQGREQIHTIQS